MTSSIGANGYCYDNAHMESLFGSLKCKCRSLDQSLNPDQVKLALFDYIEGFYNTHRFRERSDIQTKCEAIHTALG